MSARRGYCDLQVNGYGGVDFNQADLTAAQLHAACVKLRADSVATILATLITERVDKLARSLRRLVALRAQDPLAQEIIAGFHLEGPFISPVDGYRGAHPRDAVRAADLDVTKRLLEAGAGLVRLVTLAPEVDAGFQVTRHLAGQGILVAAGHTDASRDQLAGALDAGLSLFTHLGNGCPMLMHRHDNIIQRALSLADRLWCCFIADGVHVPFPTLRNYLRLSGSEHAIVVTDAVAAAGFGPGRFQIGRWDLVVGEDLAVWAPDHSHLVGSAVTMRQSTANLGTHLGLSAAACRRLTSENPRRVLRLG